MAPEHVALVGFCISSASGVCKRERGEMALNAGARAGKGLLGLLGANGRAFSGPSVYDKV